MRPGLVTPRERKRERERAEREEGTERKLILS